MILADAVGWLGTAVSLGLWLTLIDQIRRNIQGQKGSWVVATAIVVNCVVWVLYGFLLSPVAWPIVVANTPGIALGSVAAYTALR